MADQFKPILDRFNTNLRSLDSAVQRHDSAVHRCVNYGWPADFRSVEQFADEIRMALLLVDSSLAEIREHAVEIQAAQA